MDLRGVEEDEGPQYMVKVEKVNKRETEKARRSLWIIEGVCLGLC